VKQIVRRQVALAGQVVDGVTGEPVSDARVALATVPVRFQRVLDVQRLSRGEEWDRLDERADRRRTNSAGRFCFLDLPSGSYGLTVSLRAGGHRYAPGKATAVVKRNRAGHIAPAWVELVLPVTIVAGTVSGPGSRPIAFASVHVQGEPARAYTDKVGHFSLTGLEPGQRSIVVAARGFVTVAQPVSIAKPGSSKTVRISLKPAPS